MTKGTYAVVQGAQEVQQSDNSYKSFICAILIFLAICAIILLFTLIPWGSKKKSDQDAYKGSQEGLRQNATTQRTTTFGKVLDIKTTTHTTTTTPKIRNNVTISEITLSIINHTTTAASPTTVEKDTEAIIVQTTPTTFNNTTGKRFEKLIVNETISTVEDSSTTTEIPIDTTSSQLQSSQDIDVRFVVNASTSTTTSTTTTTTITTTPPTTTTELEIMETDLEEEIRKTQNRTSSTPFSNITTTTTTTASGITAWGIVPESTTEQPRLSLCETGECKSAGSRILSRMNHLVDPCENFYEFACGGVQTGNGHNPAEWVARKLEQVDEHSPSHLKKFREFYDSCVSFEDDFRYGERLTKVKAMVEEVSPFYGPNSTIPEENGLTEVLARLMLRDSAPLFDITMDVDDDHKMAFKMTLGKQSSLLRESGRDSELSETEIRCLRKLKRKLLKQPINLNTVYDKYLSCRQNYSKSLDSVHFVLDELNVTDLDSQMIRFTIDFNILGLQKDFGTPGETRLQIVSKNMSVLSVSEVQKWSDIIDWKIFLGRLVNQTVNDTDKVQVYFPNSVEKFLKRLNRVEKWKLHSAILSIYAHQLYSNLLLSQSKKTRENYCLQISTKLMRDAASSLYLSARTDLTTVQSQLKYIFDKLKSGLVKDLEGIGIVWADTSEVVQMVNRTESLKLISDGGMNLWSNKTYMEERFQDVEFSLNDFQTNVINLVQRHRRLMYDLWNKDALSEENIWWYFSAPYDTKPTFHYDLDVIVVPPGMIPPGYLELPKYVTMASVGTAMARAIGHHFDPVGIRRKLNLSSASLKSFGYAEKCAAGKYEMSTSTELDGYSVDFQIDYGSLFVGEKMTDDFAIGIAQKQTDSTSDMLLPWVSNPYTQDNIYYLVSVQEFCSKEPLLDQMIKLFGSESIPGSLRVQSFLENSASFSKAFNCALGSKMNPEYKCKQFPYLSKDDDYKYN